MLEKILVLLCLPSALAQHLCTPGKGPYLTPYFVFTFYPTKILSANTGIVTVTPTVKMYFFVASQVWNVASHLKPNRIRHITQTFAS